jgi:hypothetical protein
MADKLVDTSAFPNNAIIEVAENDPSYQAGYGRGLFGEEILEPVPKRLSTSGEKVLNKGNSWIVLGRDRTGSRSSGYGGGGATQASSIDLCVGMGALEPGAGQFADPNFKGDAARIYISQRTDIDDAFKIKGSAGNRISKSDIKFPENQSAIGIKADSVRVIGTNGIKFITSPHNKDSRGGRAAFNGIELIAGNADDELQYMVKGENLIEALEGLEGRITDLSAIVLNFLTAQLKVNAKLARHTHFGVTTTPIPIPVQILPSIQATSACLNAIMDEAESLMDNFKGRINLNINWRNKYLSEFSSKYILSKYNKVN